MALDHGGGETYVYLRDIFIPDESPGLILQVHPDDSREIRLEVRDATDPDVSLMACPVFNGEPYERTGERCVSFGINEGVVRAEGSGSHAAIEITAPNGAVGVDDVTATYRPVDAFFVVVQPPLRPG